MEEMNVVDHEKKWIDGLNRGDVSVADEVFAPDCKFYITKSQESLNLAEFKERVQKDLFSFPGRRFTIQDQINDGDRYVFRWSAVSTYSILPAGKPIRIEGLIIDRVANGKVVERREEWDQHALDVFKGLAMYKNILVKKIRRNSPMSVSLPLTTCLRIYGVGKNIYLYQNAA